MTKHKNRKSAGGMACIFCMDDPETIIEIIEKYPDFKEMYEQAYDVCRNIEEVMQMFSKELLELDRNTVKLMIDDMQKQIEEKDEQLNQKDEQIRELDEQLRQLDEQIKQSEQEIQKMKETEKNNTDKL